MGEEGVYASRATELGCQPPPCHLDPVYAFSHNERVAYCLS
jgi:hypothetical protein